jgi:glycosyltransferase involved in cell wall biosynthesis
VNQPFFSIIIPTHNRSGYLKEALEKLSEQTFKNFEVIVINDCSSDDTENVVLNHRTLNIVYHKNRVNLERSASRNIGIEKATGGYLLFLDDDDYYLPEHLDSIFQYITNCSEKSAIFYTHKTVFFEDKGHFEKKSISDIPNGDDPLKYLLFKEYTLGTPNLIVPSILAKTNLFSNKLVYSEDTEWLIRNIITNPNLHCIPIYSLVIRQHATNSGKLNKDIGMLRLESYRQILSNEIARKRIPKQAIKIIYSDCYFKSAIFNYDNNKKLTALFLCLKSILFDICSSKNIAKLKWMVLVLISKKHQ